jgi:hypothetical protein
MKVSLDGGGGVYILDEVIWFLGLIIDLLVLT